MTAEDLINELIPIFREPKIKDTVLFHFVPPHGEEFISINVALNKQIVLVYTKYGMQVISTDDILKQFLICNNIKESDLQNTVDKITKVYEKIKLDSPVCRQDIRYYKINLTDGTANLNPLGLAEYFNVMEKL